MVNRVIMVLTDEAGLRQMIKETLEGFSFTVFAPETYDEALATLKQETPALVVMDWMFNGIGAVVLTPDFQQKHSPDVPVVYAWLLPTTGLNWDMVRRAATTSRAIGIFKEVGFTNAILRLAQA